MSSVPKFDDLKVEKYKQVKINHEKYLFHINYNYNHYSSSIALLFYYKLWKQ
jgi:hypothetical protein